MNQLSESRSQTETSRHVNVAQIENTQYKEHRKTEKISENEEIITVNTQRINYSEKYVQESEVQARSVMLSVKEKLLKQSLEEFQTNSFFVYHTCQTTHASEVQNILKDLQGTVINFSNIVLNELLEEIKHDLHSTEEDPLEKLKERCGFNISLLIANGYFPYDRLVCIPKSAYARKLTDLEIYNRDYNVSMSDTQRNLAQESTKRRVEVESFVKCSLVSKLDRFDRTDINIPACIFAAYTNRWKGYEIAEVANESKELSVYQLDRKELSVHQPDRKELENFKSILNDGLKTFEIDFIREYYPQNYWENKKTLDTLGEVYNECMQNNWDVKNRHLYNQAQIFLHLYPTVDEKIKKKFDVVWFNRMQHYYYNCLSDIDFNPKGKDKCDPYDPYKSDEEDEDDGKKRKKTKEEFTKKVMERINMAPQIAEEKRRIHNFGNSHINHSRAFADEWDYAKRKCDENKKFEV